MSTRHRKGKYDNTAFICCGLVLIIIAAMVSDIHQKREKRLLARQMHEIVDVNAPLPKRKPVNPENEYSIVLLEESLQGETGLKYVKGYPLPLPDISDRIR